VVATVAVLLFLRVGASDRPALAFVAGGCILYAITDLTSALITATEGSFSYGTAIDVGWMAGYVLIALAAQHPASVAGAPAVQPKEASPVVGTVLVFTLLTVAAVCSMSGVAQCWDNAPAEPFFASLKKELAHHERYTTREQAKASIFEYVEAFYNRVRRHSSLGFLSPGDFERSHNPNHP